MKVSKSAVLIVVFAFVALIAGVGLKFYMTYHSGSSGIFKEIEKNTSPDSKEYEALKEQGKFNVLIMGEDNVEGSRRSDTILFAAINIRDRNIRILSRVILGLLPIMPAPDHPDARGRCIGRP